MTPFIKKLMMALGVMGMFVLPVYSQTETSQEPVEKGSIGLGLELGEPGTWGALGIIWIDPTFAFQPAVKADSGGKIILQVDALLHDFGIFPMKASDGALPLYIGVGFDGLFPSSSQMAVRFPLGISYIFDKAKAPLDFYLQAVPTYWFMDLGPTGWDLYVEAGSRFYF
jgi:hypothetical protein